MIDQHERDRVRTAIGTLLDLAPDAPTEPAWSRAAPPAAGSRRRAFVAVAAASTLIVGLAGLFVVAVRDNDARPASDPTTPDAAAMRPLAWVDALSASDWVVATALPAGIEYLYATTDWRAPAAVEPSRAIAYGQPLDDGTDERLRVEIGEPPATGTDEILPIDGIDWSIDTTTPGRWIASHRIGVTSVTVRGEGKVDETILRGLRVVDQGDLPFAPLGGYGDATVVARTDVDGVVYTYALQESGNYGCGWITTDDGATGGCGTRLDRDAPVTIDGGSTRQMANQTDSADVVRGGSVSTDAATVEILFVDGSTVTTQPTDLSGSFDRLYWITAATIRIDASAGQSVEDEPVIEVRAYDTAGNLIGSVAPPGRETGPGTP